MLSIAEFLIQTVWFHRPIFRFRAVQQVSRWITRSGECKWREIKMKYTIQYNNRRHYVSSNATNKNIMSLPIQQQKILYLFQYNNRIYEFCNISCHNGMIFKNILQRENINDVEGWIWDYAFHFDQLYSCQLCYVSGEGRKARVFTRENQNWPRPCLNF